MTFQRSGRARCRVAHQGRRLGVVLCLAIASVPALAQDATWLAAPGSANVNTGTNWTGGAVPTGTASFGASNTTSLTLSAATTLGGLRFNAGAPAYTFDLQGQTLTFTGNGIVNNSGNAPTFTLTTPGATLNPTNASTLGNAVLNLNLNGSVLFSNTSNAGTATITNAGGSIVFDDTSSAASARISNSGVLAFFSGSTAGNATITNTGIVSFSSTSTGANAVIQSSNGGLVQFINTSTAGNATIIQTDGSITFDVLASGGLARYVLGGTAILDYSRSRGPNGDGKVTAGSIEGTGLVAIGGGNTLFVGGNNLSTTFSGLIADACRCDVGSGALVKVGTGTLVLSGVNLYSGGTTISGGILQAASQTAVGIGNVTLDGGTFQAGGTLTIVNGFALNATGGSIDSNGNTLTLSGVIANGNGAGTLTKVGAGTLVLTSANTYTGGTIISAGTLQAAKAGALGSGAVTLNGGTFQAGSANLGFANAFALNTTGGAIDSNGNVLTLSGVIANGNGPGTLTKTGTGTLTLAGANTYTGATIVNAGTLAVSGAGSIAASSGVTLAAGTAFDVSGTASGASIQTLAGVAGSTVTLGAQPLTITNASTSFAGTISGTGGLTLTSGTLTLSGTNTYTGPTLVGAGTLIVNGSIAASNRLVVGGTLGGIGTVPSATIFGTLSPGNSIGTLNVAGNLVFAPGSVYLVELSSTASDRTNVTGTASLNGTLRLVPVGAGFAFGNSYTILSAQRGLVGTFAQTDSRLGLGAAMIPVVNYGATDVTLTLLPAPLAPLLPPSLPTNPRRLALALDLARTNGANLSPLFNLYNLSGLQLGAGLNQLDGELATVVPSLGFLVNGRFLNTMLDRYVRDRLGARSTPAARYAADTPMGEAAEAADLAAGPTTSFNRVTRVWAEATSQNSHTIGDSTSGAAAIDLRHSGLVAGADITLDPNTVVGFAAGGGDATATIAQNQGSAHVDLAQVGLYGSTRFDALYIAASGSYTRLDTSTQRNLTFIGGSLLTASFKAQLWGGRIETGYRLDSLGGFSVPDTSLTPYAALQMQSVRTPGYREADLSGQNLGLAYQATTARSTRTELGLYLDVQKALSTGETFAAFARAAWAHEFERARAITASLPAIPGVTFQVNGTQPAADSAIISTGLDVKFNPTLTLGARFDGEMSSRTTTYSGTARLSLTW